MSLSRRHHRPVLHRFLDLIHLLLLLDVPLLTDLQNPIVLDLHHLLGGGCYLIQLEFLQRSLRRRKQVPPPVAV
ncbi:hypothetical protein RHGRI_014180 [Rhododendron griersonianum]|uniref:Secreted protein n=1 Tax=Rhododendron griersonianum TaxID=479676 RepID=A0AAV6K8D3_9ERIC|nr:hypothetical protein RHGRI_014180 [Rhododendron griersonianum]